MRLAHEYRVPSSLATAVHMCSVKTGPVLTVPFYLISLAKASDHYHVRTHSLLCSILCDCRDCFRLRREQVCHLPRVPPRGYGQNVA